MKSPRRRRDGKPPAPARLPAVLLLSFLSLVGLTVLWLHFWGGAPEKTVPGEAPRVEIALGETRDPVPPVVPPGDPTPSVIPPGDPAPAAAPAAPPTPEAVPPPPADPATAGPVSIAPPAAAPRLRVTPAHTGPPLTPAPDAALVEQTPRGALPRIGLDGREPWRVYARPFDAGDERPRIALVVQELGISEAVTRSAISGLPGGVTLAFSPYADGLEALVAAARTAGHEVLIMVPMEPDSYPASDPGPQALMTSLEPAANIERLHWTLSRTTGYVGIASYMGSRFATSRRHARPILEETKARGLLMLASDQGSGSVFGDIAGALALPFAASTMFVDSRLSASDIDARLEELERIAQTDGRVIAMARSLPVSIERIAAWAGDVEGRGFVLAPVSALADHARRP